jgi:FtsK/SpoIIIE family
MHFGFGLGNSPNSHNSPSSIRRGRVYSVLGGRGVPNSSEIGVGGAAAAQHATGPQGLASELQDLIRLHQQLASRYRALFEQYPGPIPDVHPGVMVCTNNPEQARIGLIDPKRGVDYFPFEGLPHLESGLIDDQSAAIAKFNELVGEMERRYAVLRQNRVGDIYKLNAKSDGTERLPYLSVIHEEFAEWLMTDEYRETVTNTVNRLGIMARAAGIFLIFAAQRPDATVMPMQLRTNLGNRLVLKVDAKGTSEIALGERNGGAERLLGKGHLAAKLVNVPPILYAQVPLIDDSELARILDGSRRAK